MSGYSQHTGITLS